jgi:hypothetical protein
VKEFFLNTLKPFFTRRRILLIVATLLVAGWALVNFNHDHRMYALFIVAFFLVSLLLPKPSFTLVVVSVVAYVLLSSVAIPALSQVRNTIMDASVHPKAPITNLMTPHTGLEVLPEVVQQMLGLIEAHDEVTSYRLSAGLSEDYHTVQRITESAWPVRPVESSPYVLVGINEIPDYLTCTVVDETEEVALVHCP